MGGLEQMSISDRQIPTNTNTPFGFLSPRDFLRLGALIDRECGIRMPEAKKSMLEVRLGKRVKALALTSFREYCDFLFSPEGQQQELLKMIDVVTTNKTDFFREAHHFTYLTQIALPALMALGNIGVRTSLSVWSAGCSSGEEVYSLSMAISEFAGSRAGYRFSVLGTDISTRVLEKAASAVYEEERVEPVPIPLRKKYLLRSRDSQKKLVKIAPALRQFVRFRRLNFMDEDYGMKEPFHVIFCRNVIIYFDRQTRERLLKRLCSHVVQGGYLFTGHSEILNGIALPLSQCAPTVYRKTK